MIITKKGQVTIDSLEAYTNYSVSVLGYTGAGDGVASRAVVATTSQDKPGKPDKIKAFLRSESSIIAVWQPPKETNGVITQYKVYRDRYTSQVRLFCSFLIGPILNQSESIVSQNGLRTLIVSAEQTSIQIDGVRLLEDYNIYVTASTVAGEGPPSDAIKVTVNSKSQSENLVQF